MACIKALVWLFIGIVSKVQGYANGLFPEACESMSPVHRGVGGVPYTPQNTKAPYNIFFELGSSLAEPITVVLNTTSTPFSGFMLEARMHEGTDDKFALIGKCIIVEPDKTQLLTCGGLEGTAVSQTNNQLKKSIRVKWNITAQERKQNITFRATVVESLGMFWECVNATLPVLSSPTKPSTTETTKSSTTETTKPRTTETTKPRTTETTKPRTTETTKPRTTETTKPNTEGSHTTSPSPVPTYKTVSVLEQAGTAMMSFDCAVKVVKTELSNIVTVIFACNSFYHHLSKMSKMMCTILCAALEISSLILFCVGESKVSLISLVTVATVVNFTELIIVSLTIRPSHELEEIHNIAVQVCCVISEIFALAVAFVGALEVDQSKQYSSESWLLNVLAAFTVWIGLFIVWLAVFNTGIKAILKTRMIGNVENSQTRQQNKETLSSTRVAFIIISTVFIIGATAFAVAVTVGIFV